LADPKKTYHRTLGNEGRESEGEERAKGDGGEGGRMKAGGTVKGNGGRRGREVSK